MTTATARMASVGFGLAVGSAGAAVLTTRGIEPEIAALGAILAILAIGNAVACESRSRSVLPVLLGASAAVFVGLAAGSTASPSIVLLAVTLPPVVVWMRHRVADAAGASFVRIAAHDASVAIGAAVVVTAIAFEVPAWVPPALAAVSLGFALGVAIVPDPSDRRTGTGSTFDGFGRWATVAWGSIGVAVGAAIPAVLAIQDERWAINLQGRAMTVAGGLTIGAASLAVGHWYHRLETATDDRRANSAGLALAIVGGLLVGSAYSTTLIGIVTVLMGAIAIIVFAAALIDVLAWDGRTSDSRLRATGFSAAAAIAGGTVGLMAATGLAGWTDRSIVVLGSLPLVMAGLWALRRTRGAGRIEEPVPVTAPTVGTAFLEVSGLESGYDRVTVLHGVDLTVEPGDVLAVMGMNGVGKTTLLRTLAGLLEPRRGAIVMGGADITDFPAAWRTELGICHIAGADSVVPDLTVDETLAMYAHGTRIGPDDFAQRRADAAAMFPILAERSGQRAETLSGGERQMLALAKAIVQRPRLLLIDEFSLGLAPAVVESLVPAIRALTASGTPTILVEQRVDTALALATRVVVLDKGRITWRGNAERLAGDPDLIAELFLPPVGADLP